MKRTIYDGDHELFRDSARAFAERELVPHVEEWERAGIVPREVFTRAGEAGLLGMAVPEAFGGAGVEDFRFNAVITEAFTEAGVGSSGGSVGLHNDVCLPYLIHSTTDEQKARWLPGTVSGAIMTAIAMTEPGTGSDLAGIQTTAIREGDHYVLNGAKTFITNGINSDLVIVAAKTDPSQSHSGLSLLVVERGMEGFTRGRNLEKLGLHAQDTAELFFDDVRVPVANLLGAEGTGFFQLVDKLPQERLSISVGAVAASEVTLAQTISYVKERTAFGKPIASFQATRFALAEMQTEVEIARVFVDRQVEALNAGELTAEEAAMGKWWTTELQGRVVDRCLQLHGGYGYMMEYPVARAYADARVQRIYGGTNEIMKEIIGRSLVGR
jgi:alkylation response protein AidB-like acyl-CoA dehydrogenase